MSYFDRSAEALMPPANASLIDELISTIETGSADEHLRILQRVTDLFMAGSRRYSGPQIELFDAVPIDRARFDQVDRDVRRVPREGATQRLRRDG